MEQDRNGRSMADQLADTMIAEIRSGEMAEGVPLPTERTLCERFGTSRPTVRQALMKMQLRGYVSQPSSKRPRATKPSIERIIMDAGDHIRELVGDAESGAYVEQIRQFIEVGAVGVAAKHTSHLQIAQIRDALEACYQAIGDEEFARSDIVFHRALVSVVDNPIILKLHDMFVSMMLRHRPAVADRAAHDQMVYEEHRQIYEAVLCNDVEAAMTVMDRHLARSYRARLARPRKIAEAS